MTFKIKAQKYLEKFGASEANVLAKACCYPSRWRHVLAVPLCSEAEYLPNLLASIEAACHSQGKVLCIFLVNNRENATEKVFQNNRRALAHLVDDSAEQGQGSNVKWYLRHGGAYDSLVIDRSTYQPFKEKEGVGLARKIVSDVAIALMANGSITGQWVRNTDGDATLPPDFFSREEVWDRWAGTSAVIAGYAHIRNFSLSESHWKSACYYEAWLRYYENGLRDAGSPYGFATIGSLISFHKLCYVQVRGFPNREAAEDFYLLNKLAKMGVVRTDDELVVELLDRESSRVPFGTGQGVRKINGLLDSGEEYRVYDPRVFECLQLIITGCTDFITNGGYSFSPIDHEKILDDDEWEDILDQFRFEEGCKGALGRSRSIDGAIAQFHNWFDSFKTLKFIHYLRDCHFPSLPIESVPFTRNWVETMESS